MGKIQGTGQAEPTLASKEMIRSCKKEMYKYGITERDFQKFLSEVKAMSTDMSTYVKFSNEEIEKYREAYVRKHESSFSDTMVFDKYARIKNQDDKKIWHESGDFCPADFWRTMRRQTV